MWLADATLYSSDLANQTQILDTKNAKCNSQNENLGRMKFSNLVLEDKVGQALFLGLYNILTQPNTKWQKPGKKITRSVREIQYPNNRNSRKMARGKGRKERLKEIMPDNFPMKYMKDSLSTSIMTIKRPTWSTLLWKFRTPG